DASQTTVSLSQLIELGGKRAARNRVAEAEHDLARWDYETRRIDLLTGVTEAFLETLASQEKLTLSEELLNIAQRSLETVAGTVRSGAVSAVEEGRARVALSQVRIEHEQRTRELEQRKATLSLARAKAIPDVTLSAGGRYYQDEQEGGVVALFSVPLPVFDRRQGEILAAERRLRGARLEQTSVAVTLRSELARTHEALSSAYRQAIELRDRTIPEASAVFEGARNAYSRGLFRYLEVLDAQRTLFQLRADYVGALL